ncbi:ATP-binding protein [Geochorda subterranea]|uniref:DUF499 domain-containing protein n=1 Tax=Geochorda subterranea TaxID=3109564 RepID=A0ABZ1BT98_9FIRM|nr:DUF499 domain-containing protein [Limnochorda sp. LNt]WRP15861.1 DUF499 domain-containing protein [Limnochorda sp. LNt]
MRTIFDTCQPRQDVLTGQLTEDKFAADLHGVALKERGIDPIYRDARVFFTYTYPTRGLRDLVRHVFGRFVGVPGASPVVRLETSVGGGKTHNLIALWHLASSPGVAMEAARDWLPARSLPDHPLRPVALVGDRYGGSEAALHDGVVTRTLWGEMAWQLDRYEVMREVDETRQVPSESRLKEVLAGRKVVVLLDELARYLRTAKGQKVGSSNLANQTLTFFHMLLAYAVSHDDLVVVYTLTGADDAYAVERDEIVEQEQEVLAISAKFARVMTPVAEDELASVLRRRLFERIDMGAAEEIAQSYVQHLRLIRRQGAPMPAEVDEPTFADRFREAYPFHPELLTTLFRKTASYPTFHRTRGALRLLAAVVRQLWRERPADAYLIQSTDIDLSHPVVREELTSRLDRAHLTTAIAEDIWSEHGDAHAQELDREWASRGMRQLSQRVAQVVFLHSLVHTSRLGVAGAEPAEVHLACARPGLPFDLVDKALAQIDELFWYADFDGRRYLFHDEATIKKVIAQATSRTGLVAAKDAIRLKVREQYGGTIFRLVPFPPGPEGVDDEAGRPQLVVLDFDHVTVETGSTEVPAVVQEIFERAGEGRDFRHYQNNLILLVCDTTKKDAMVDAARRFKGIESLLESEELRQRLADADRRKLQEAHGKAALDFVVAIRNAYSHLYYRSLHDGLMAHYELLPQESADVKRPAQVVLRSVLEAQSKVLTRDLAPQWVLDRIWPEGKGHEAQLSLADLVDRFARRPRAYMLLDEGLQRLRVTIQQGVKQELWVYRDESTERTYRKDRPPSTEQVRFGQDALLLTPALADRLYPQERPQPVAVVPAGDGQPQASDGAAGTRPPVRPAPPVVEVEWVEAEGPAPQAFTAVADRLRERGRVALSELRLDVVGAPGVRRLADGWSAVDNALAGADVMVMHELEASDSQGQRISLRFEGPGRLFARLHGWLRATLDGLSSDPHVLTRIHARFPGPVALSDPRLARLARDLEETYRCGPVGVRGR